MNYLSCLPISLLLLATTANSQMQNPAGSMLEAMRDGANSARMIVESERIRAETELLRLKIAELRKSGSAAKEAPRIDASALMWAWVRAQDRFPDIHFYRAEVGPE